jgi:site-specific recombinase XerD
MVVGRVMINAVELERGSAITFRFQELEPTVSDLISIFLADEAKNNTTVNTLKALRTDLGLLLRWYDATHGRPFRLADLTQPDVRAWTRASFTSKPVAPATANRRKNSLRRLVNWAIERGDLVADPTRGMKDLPLGERASRGISPLAIERILHAASQNEDGQAALRDVALLSVLAYTGLRVEELCQLDVANMNLAGRRVIVRRGKGGKGRTVGLHEDAVDAVRRYLNELRLDMAASDGPLWIHREGVGRAWVVGITQNSVQSLVRELADLEARKARADAMVARRLDRRDELERLAQELDRTSPHAFRHSFVRRMLEAGYDPRREHPVPRQGRHRL